MGPELKAKEEVHMWEVLCKQIKDNLAKEHGKNKICTNQLTILRNFAMLHIKEMGHIAVSEDITWQWHEGAGIHFTHQVQLLACYY